jgi:hypothetical protein
MIVLFGGDMNLYSDGRYKPKTKTGFGSGDIARQTLKNISKYSLTYQKQVVITMYNRAKYHPHHTSGMLDAMKVFKKWMKKNNVSSRTKSRKQTKQTKQTKHIENHKT